MALSAAALVGRLRAALKTGHEVPGSEFSATLSTFLKTEDKAARIELLTKHFCLEDLLSTGAPPYPGEYNGAPLLLELVEEALSFALQRGFTFSEIYVFLCLYMHSLDLTYSITQVSDASQTLQVVVEEFKKIVGTYLSAISQTKLLISIEYITDTVFQHYRLYHYLLTNTQPVDYTHLKLDVDVPQSPAPLVDGLEEGEWSRREKVRELEAEQLERKREVVAACALAQQKTDTKLKQAYQTALDRISGDVTAMTQNDVTEIIDSLAVAHMESTKTAISQSLQEHDLDVQLKVQKVEVLSPKREQQPSPQAQTNSPKKRNKTPSGRNSKKS